MLGEVERINSSGWVMGGVGGIIMNNIEDYYRRMWGRMVG
jgi:hypothetical protein